MNFIKPNLKSLPEQVDINTNDIKNLKSVLKSSYKTEKELETTTITIPITDTNAPQDTTSGWLYDSIGHLFSINGGDNTNLLLEYYTNFRGPAGINGVAVVQTTGSSTESVMSQNAVTTELESKANLDASNLSPENVTSWTNKLGCENVENIEVIYDKDSNDPNINWGYTSGFKNISVTGKDFTKYKILRAYFTKNESSNANILEVGIRRDVSENIVRSEATQDVDLISTGTNLRSLYITVESNSSIAFNYIAGNSDFYQNENAYCYKIEGVY